MANKHVTKSGGSELRKKGSVTTFESIEVCIRVLMTIVCLWATPQKANGSSPDISVHFWAMDQSPECTVSDETISVKPIKKIRWSKGNNSFIIGLMMRGNMKRYKSVQQIKNVSERYLASNQLALSNRVVLRRNDFRVLNSL